MISTLLKLRIAQHRYGPQSFRRVCADAGGTLARTVRSFAAFNGSFIGAEARVCRCCTQHLALLYDVLRGCYGGWTNQWTSTLLNTFWTTLGSVVSERSQLAASPHQGAPPVESTAAVGTAPPGPAPSKLDRRDYLPSRAARHHSFSSRQTLRTGRDASFAPSSTVYSRSKKQQHAEPATVPGGHEDYRSTTCGLSGKLASAVGSTHFYRPHRCNASVVQTRAAGGSNGSGPRSESSAY